MIKTMKRIRRVFTIALVFAMLFVSQLTVFAATREASFTADKDMSIALMPGVTGDSNTITFRVSLPAGATVTEVKIDCSRAASLGGKGAVMAQTVTITSPSGETHTIGWGSGNVSKTTLFTGEDPNGTWTVYMTGRNISSASLGSAYIGGTKYTKPTLTISYIP